MADRFTPIQNINRKYRGSKTIKSQDSFHTPQIQNIPPNVGQNHHDLFPSSPSPPSPSPPLSPRQKLLLPENDKSSFPLLLNQSNHNDLNTSIVGNIEELQDPQRMEKRIKRYTSEESEDVEESKCPWWVWLVAGPLSILLIGGMIFGIVAWIDKSRKEEADSLAEKYEELGDLQENEENIKDMALDVSAEAETDKVQDAGKGQVEVAKAVTSDSVPNSPMLMMSSVKRQQVSLVDKSSADGKGLNSATISSESALQNSTKPSASEQSDNKKLNKVQQPVFVRSQKVKTLVNNMVLNAARPHLVNQTETENKTINLPEKQYVSRERNRHRLRFRRTFTSTNTDSEKEQNKQNSAGSTPHSPRNYYYPTRSRYYDSSHRHPYYSSNHRHRNRNFSSNDHINDNPDDDYPQTEHPNPEEPLPDYQFSSLRDVENENHERQRNRQPFNHHHPNRHDHHYKV